MAESEELKGLLIKVKEKSEKVGLKFNIQKTRIMASGPITSWEIDREIMETVRNFIFLHFSLSCIGEGNGNPLQCSCLGIPETGEPGGLPSMGRTESDTTEVTYLTLPYLIQFSSV